jgi:hypothetical protein
MVIPSTMCAHLIVQLIPRKVKGILLVIPRSKEIIQQKNFHCRHHYVHHFVWLSVGD